MSTVRVSPGSRLGLLAAVLLVGCSGGPAALKQPIPGVGPTIDAPAELVAFLKTLPAEVDGKPVHYPVTLFDRITVESLRSMPVDAVVRKYARPRPPTLEGAGIGLAMGPPEFCTPDFMRSFRCSTAVLVGDSSQDQNVYVFVTGVESLNGAHFGIRYTEGIEVVDWFDCPASRPLAIRSDDFPASGSHIALAFDCVTRRDGRAHLLGNFRIAAGSKGVMQVTGLSFNEGAVASVNRCDDVEGFVPNPSGFGRVVVDAETADTPYLPCDTTPE